MYALFAGTGNPRLAHAIASELGVEPGRCEVERFPDGELTVRLEESVRGRDVFIVQPTAPPVNENLIELLAFADACRRAAAGRIVAVVPYFGYARAERRRERRVPVMAAAVAGLLESVGVQHIVTLDLHAAQIEGFFRIPVENLTAIPALSAAMRGRIDPETVVVSPDFGAVDRASRFAESLGLPVLIVAKRRVSGREVEVRQLVGEVRDRPCLLVDDMISTGGTILKAVEALRAAGARPDCTVVATHGLFTGDSRAALAAAGVSVVVTDSVAGPEPSAGRVTVAPLLARAIARVAGTVPADAGK